MQSIPGKFGGNFNLFETGLRWRKNSEKREKRLCFRSSCQPISFWREDIFFFLLRDSHVFCMNSSLCRRTPIKTRKVNFCVVYLEIVCFVRRIVENAECFDLSSICGASAIIDFTLTWSYAIPFDGVQPLMFAGLYDISSFSSFGDSTKKLNKSLSVCAMCVHQQRLYSSFALSSVVNDKKDRNSSEFCVFRCYQWHCGQWVFLLNENVSSSPPLQRDR